MVPQLYAFLIPSYTCLPFTYSSLAWPLFLSTPKKTVPVLQPLGVLMFLVSSKAVILMGVPSPKSISTPLEIVRSANSWSRLQTELNQNLPEISSPC